jgi:GNAT superfamily N-acetyltransferase
MNHRLPTEQAVTGEVARGQLQNLIGGGQARGLLAYRESQCVGWCAVDPLTTQPGHDYVIETNDTDPQTWSIHCIYVRPDCRGLGVSSRLIDASVEFAHANGAETVLAFPIPPESKGKFPKHEAEFSGRFSSFQKRGFSVKQQLNDFYCVMEKKLEWKRNCRP